MSPRQPGADHRPPACRAAVSAWLLLGVLLVGACARDDEEPVAVPEGIATIDVSSSAFLDGDEIPVEHTCDGEDVAPPLEWSGVPPEAAEVVVLVTDPDAPGGDFTHWVVTGIPAEATSPDGGTQGQNDFGAAGWNGPCPPDGDDAHRYVFLVLAVDEPLDVDPPATAETVAEATEGDVIAAGELVGHYGR